MSEKPSHALSVPSPLTRLDPGPGSSARCFPALAAVTFPWPAAAKGRSQVLFSTHSWILARTVVSATPPISAICFTDTPASCKAWILRIVPTLTLHSATASP